MARPKGVISALPSEVLSARLPVWMVKALEDEARQVGVTRNEFVERKLKKTLSAKGYTEPEHEFKKRKLYTKNQETTPKKKPRRSACDGESCEYMQEGGVCTIQAPLFVPGAVYRRDPGALLLSRCG